MEFIKGSNNELISLGKGGTKKVVCDFYPSVISRHVIKNISTGQELRTYNISVLTANSEKSEFAVTSLDDIDFFALAGIPYALVGKYEQSLIKYKLQQDSLSASTKESLIVNPGFFQYGVSGRGVALADTVLFTNNCKNISSVKSKDRLISNVNLDRSLESFANEARSYITAVPSISLPIFYHSLLGIASPILRSMGVRIDYVLAIIGPSGSLKTSTVRRFALYLRDTGSQEVTFRSSQRMDSVSKKIESMDGLNFLIDDIHATNDNHSKNMQQERLDCYTRLATQGKDGANLFITGEHLTGIFSCIDRCLQIKSTKLSAEERKKCINKLSGLTSEFICQLSLRFAYELLVDYEDVKMFVESFMKETSVDDYAEAFRVLRHAKILSLCESLYCKYVCGNNTELSCHDLLVKILGRNVSEQIRLLQSIQQREEQKDLVLEVERLFSEKRDFLRIVTKSNLYNYKDKQAYFENDTVYITPINLKRALTEFLGRTVSPRQLSKELSEAGVLNQESETVKTKKKFEVRHFAIDRFSLKKYHESICYENALDFYDSRADETVPVHQKPR